MFEDLTKDDKKSLLKIAKSDSFRKNSTFSFLGNEFLVKMYKH